jgi:hypothetical protein
MSSPDAIHSSDSVKRRQPSEQYNRRASHRKQSLECGIEMLRSKKSNEGKCGDPWITFEDDSPSSLEK